MGKISNAKDFWDLFSVAFKDKFSNDPENSRRAHECDCQWTKWMIPLLEKIGEDNDYYPDCEYWPRVDVGYFSCRGKAWSSWSFEVAIEHENGTWPYWQDELNKLMAINAGLKVLITYWYDYDELMENLREFENIYKSRKYYQKNDNYLLIFGPNTAIRDKKSFLAFSFDGTKVSEIPGSEEKLFIR